MSLKTIDLKEVKAIVDWVNVTEDVREFSLKFGELEIFISRNTQAATAQPGPQAAPVSVATPPAAAPAITTPARRLPLLPCRQVNWPPTRFSSKPRWLGPSMRGPNPDPRIL